MPCAASPGGANGANGANEAMGGGGESDTGSQHRRGQLSHAGRSGGGSASGTQLRRVRETGAQVVSQVRRPGGTAALSRAGEGATEAIMEDTEAAESRSETVRSIPSPPRTAAEETGTKTKLEGIRTGNDREEGNEGCDLRRGATRPGRHPANGWCNSGRHRATTATTTATAAAATATTAAATATAATATAAAATATATTAAATAIAATATAAATARDCDAVGGGRQEARQTAFSRRSGDSRCQRGKVGEERVKATVSLEREDMGSVRGVATPHLAGAARRIRPTERDSAKSRTGEEALAAASGVRKGGCADPGEGRREVRGRQLKRSGKVGEEPPRQVVMHVGPHEVGNFVRRQSSAGKPGERSTAGRDVQHDTGEKPRRLGEGAEAVDDDGRAEGVEVIPQGGDLRSEGAESSVGSMCREVRHLAGGTTKLETGGLVRVKENRGNAELIGGQVYGRRVQGGIVRLEDAGNIVVLALAAREGHLLGEVAVPEEQGVAVQERQHMGREASPPRITGNTVKGDNVEGGRVQSVVKGENGSFGAGGMRSRRERDNGQQAPRHTSHEARCRRHGRRDVVGPNTSGASLGDNSGDTSVLGNDIGPRKVVDDNVPHGARGRSGIDGDERNRVAIVVDESGHGVTIAIGFSSDGRARRGPTVRPRVAIIGTGTVQAVELTRSVPAKGHRKVAQLGRGPASRVDPGTREAAEGDNTDSHVAPRQEARVDGRTEWGRGAADADGGRGRQDAEERSDRVVEARDETAKVVEGGGAEHRQDPKSGGSLVRGGGAVHGRGPAQSKHVGAAPVSGNPTARTTTAAATASATDRTGDERSATTGRDGDTNRDEGATSRPAGAPASGPAAAGVGRGRERRPRGVEARVVGRGARGTTPTQVGQGGEAEPGPQGADTGGEGPGPTRGRRRAIVGHDGAGRPTWTCGARRS